MFERFTTPARESVIRAQQQARRLGAGRIDTEHLLLGMLEVPDGLVVRVLGMYGLGHAEVEAELSRFDTDQLDAEALRSIGIDLEAVREKVEAAFGAGALDRPRGRSRSGHIPFTPRAKKVLELALREAVRLRHRTISDGHILLGILRDGSGVAVQVLTYYGLGVDSLRHQVEQEMAQPAESDTA